MRDLLYISVFKFGVKTGVFLGGVFRFILQTENSMKTA